MLDKPEDEVTKDERQGAKAVSFGRPGGMGAASLKRQAKEAYGVELTDEEVQARIDAYETLAPGTEGLPDRRDRHRFPTGGTLTPHARGVRPRDRRVEL